MKMPYIPNDEEHWEKFLMGIWTTAMFIFFFLQTKQKSIISQRYAVCLPSARVFQVTRKKTMYESKHSGCRGGELKELILPKVTGKRPEV